MKAAQLFRKNLEKNGFAMMQFSVYIRHCVSKESLRYNVKNVTRIYTYQHVERNRQTI